MTKLQDYSWKDGLSDAGCPARRNSVPNGNVIRVKKVQHMLIVRRPIRTVPNIYIKDLLNLASPRGGLLLRGALNLKSLLGRAGLTSLGILTWARKATLIAPLVAP